jgi:predicted lactoylglutathione lyase
MIYDHVDLRVSSLAAARAFYDPLMKAMGLQHFDTDGKNINYYFSRGERSKPFFGLMQQAGHRGDASRVAFRAASREHVDRLASIARDAGAQAFEAPESYGASSYYATFFEDMDGNKLEICYREEPL